MMLLRKELESLELTYPDEYSTVSNTTETSAVSTTAKVYSRQLLSNHFNHKNKPENKQQQQKKTQFEFIQMVLQNFIETNSK